MIFILTIFNPLNKIILSLFLDKELKWTDNFNNTKKLEKDYQCIINKEKMIFNCKIIKRNVNFYEDEYILDLILKNKNNITLIYYEASIKLPSNDKPLNEIFSNDELITFISIYESLRGRSCYFTKDFYLEDIFNFSNSLYEKDEQKIKILDI